MFNFFSKPAVTAFTILALTACGAANHHSELATVGGSKNFLTCSDHHANFIIRDTAVATVKQGVLSGNLGTATFSCKAAAKKTGPVIADENTVLWSCDEVTRGASLKHVKVERLGLVPATVAYVSIDQMFPLGPKVIATLGCKN